MKSVSIDLETTGLDPKRCDVIEFAAVVFDTDSTIAVEDMPKFHAYLAKETYQGEPFARGMHAAIFKRIANREPRIAYLTEEQMGGQFADWLRAQGFENRDDGRVSIQCTGKNFAMFDARFLERIESWRDSIVVAHQVIDVGTLLLDPRTDQKIPDTRECLNRAGLDTTLTHTAVEDARNVIRLLRFVWSRS